MKTFLAVLLRLRPAGPGVTPDAAFLLPAGAMLSHDWLAPQVALTAAGQPRRSSNNDGQAIR
jgi:hypothetical protein